MALYSVMSHEGIPFVGAVEQIENLEEPYRANMMEQIARAAQGQKMESVKIPAPVLERAGFRTKEQFLDEQATPPEQPEEDDERYDPMGLDAVGGRNRVVRNDLRDAREDVRNRRARIRDDRPRDMDRGPESWNTNAMCVACPFREAAMKLIAKTLEKI